MTSRKFTSGAESYQSHTKQLRLSRTLKAEYYGQLAAAAEQRAADAKLPKDRDGRIRSPGRKGMLPADYIAHLRWMLQTQDIGQVARLTGKGQEFLKGVRDFYNRPEIAPAFSQEWHEKLAKDLEK